jgi:hypothetical protein
MLAPDVELILSNTDRLITTFRCVVSLGLGDGPEEILSTKPPENKPDWHEAVAGFQRDTLSMAALRATILLDRDEVNFPSERSLSSVDNRWTFNRPPCQLFRAAYMPERACGR